MKYLAKILILILPYLGAYSQTYEVEYQKVDGKVRAVYTQSAGDGQITVNQSSHPFDLSSPPYIKIAIVETSGSWALASSDNPFGFYGIVVEDVSADTFKVITSGAYATTSAHGLTVGAVYYLNTNGNIGLERGNYELPVLKVIDANRFEVLPQAPMQIIEVQLPSDIPPMSLQEYNVINTKGFYNEGDGGDAYYIIEKTIPTGLQVDSATVIQLANGNYAVLSNYKNANVLQLGLKKDSTSLDAHIVNRVNRILALGDAHITFPKGVYNANQRVTTAFSGSIYTFLKISDDNDISIIGEAGANIVFPNDSSQTNRQCFLTLENASNITIQGLTVTGFIECDSSFSRDLNPAIYTISNIVNLRVQNNEFYSCNPVTYVSDRDHKYFNFYNNYVQNAPNAVVPCDYSQIQGNRFVNINYSIDRSHAIYAYGSFGSLTVNNNYFTLLGGYALKFRGENGVNNIKKNVVFSNNVCENLPEIAVDLGTLNSDLSIYNYIVSNNVFNNTKGCLTGFNVSGVVVTNNVVNWDLTSTLTDNVAFNIAGTNSFRDARMKNVIISNNTVEDTRNVIYEFVLNDLPIENDELVIGAYTYTFKASVSDKYDIAIAGDLASQVEAIADKLKSSVGNGGLVGVLAIGAEDIRGDVITFNIILNLVDVTVITTDLDITYSQNGVDYRGTSDGLQVALVSEPSIYAQNTFYNLGQAINVNTSYNPIIRHNIINGYNAVISVNVNQCAYPVFENNNTDNRFGYSKDPYRVDIRNSFQTTFRDNVGFTSLSFASQIYDIFSSSLSKCNAGTGYAENIFWFGLGSIPSPDSTLFTVDGWEEGDQVLLDSASTNLYTFTYKEEGSLGANEFNSKITLVALIDATSQFVASSPGSDEGMFKITAAASGTAGNNYKIRTISNCRLCGKYLQENFVGGSASADVTVFWTTEGTNYNVPTVTPINSGATSLTGVYVDIANSVPGKYYLIKHSNAGGTEELLIKM